MDATLVSGGGLVRLAGCPAGAVHGLACKVGEGEGGAGAVTEVVEQEVDFPARDRFLQGDPTAPAGVGDGLEGDRHEGDADALGDHFEDGAEVGGVEPDLPANVAGLAEFVDLAAEAVEFTQDESLLAFEVLPTQLASAGERVFGRDEHAQRFQSEGFGVDGGVDVHGGDEGQVNQAFVQALEQSFGDLLDHFDFDAGMLADETGDQAGQQTGCNGGDGADDQPPFQGLATIGHAAGCVGQFGQHASGPFVESAAGLGGDDAPRQAVEQGLAEFLFEFGDLLAERGLGDVEPGGGAGKAARLHHGDEVPELLQFHRICLWQPS